MERHIIAISPVYALLTLSPHKGPDVASVGDCTRIAGLPTTHACDRIFRRAKCVEVRPRFRHRLRQCKVSSRTGVERGWLLIPKTNQAKSSGCRVHSKGWVAGQIARARYNLSKRRLVVAQPRRWCCRRTTRTRYSWSSGMMFDDGSCRPRDAVTLNSNPAIDSIGQ